MNKTQIDIAVFAYRYGFGEAIKMIQANITDATMNINDASIRDFFSKIQIQEEPSKSPESIDSKQII